MKVVIIGSRNLENDDAKKWLKSHLQNSGATEIISGGNVQGVGKITKEIAQEIGIQLIEMLPNYAEYGRIAPHLRNNEMIKEADFVLCVWNGTSKGTEHEIKLCKKYGKKLIAKTLNPEQEKMSLF